MAHTLDHSDLEERKRRSLQMKEWFGEEAVSVADNNTRADLLAKWARDNPEAFTLNLPHILTEQERYALHDAENRKIFSPRKYLRRQNYSAYLKDVQQLTLMPWLQQTESIDQQSSHAVFLQANPRQAPLQNFAYKMRRKLLYEKAMILKRIQTRPASYTRKRYPNPPENGRCERCGQEELGCTQCSHALTRNTLENLHTRQL